MTRFKIEVKGTIQGVGFRPFIYNLAKKYNIFGYILNNSNGVLIEIETLKSNFNTFIEDIKLKKPHLAIIDSINITEIKELENFEEFEIKKSKSFKNITAIMPIDSGICKDCENELNDKKNIRYNYPFINCTNCGPRFTIIENLPYDRANTSMSKFQMCSFCKSEYEEPTNRRFHAEPISCPECGPKLSLLDREFKDIKNPIENIVKFLKEGKIVAMKGYGGFHLVCDSQNIESIKRLREIKNRKRKPFALMLESISKAKEIAHINQTEKNLLTSPQKPIVLLKAKDNNLSNLIAPNLDKIGIFLPYSPIHYLIMKKFRNPLIVTSANITNEPLIIDIEEFKKTHLADYILDFDRDIINRCDDSVAMVIDNREILLRRARGFSPSNIKLPFKLDKKTLATGANQKSTFAIGFEDNIIISPHIGNLDSIKSIDSYKNMIDRFKKIYNFQEELIVADKHQNYESTKWANSQNSSKKYIQHHYAHTLSLLHEHNIKSDVISIVFDGTGFGDDKNLWGGEFFIANQSSYERIYHFKYLKLLGGALAIKNPKRVALAILFDIFKDKTFEIENPTLKSFSQKEIKNLFLMFEKSLNSPLSSSAGRIFDAVASLANICHEIDYEGEAGSVMESFYDSSIKEAYEFKIDKKIIDYEDIFKSILIDRDSKVIVSKFINALINLIVKIQKKHKLPLILSGGVFQNRAFLENLIKKLKVLEVEFYISEKIPTNDGGISFGSLCLR